MEPDALLWADVDDNAARAGWFESNWYGWVYADKDSYTHWIWHAKHGWQYVAPCSIEGTCYIWDEATATWWYVGGKDYPYVYSYSTGLWYYYYSGATPDRIFYDWSANSGSGGFVKESSLHKSDNPCEN